MRVKRLVIRPQKYPTHTGARPLSYAIWLLRPWKRKIFVGYSWSLAGAYVALQYLRKNLNAH